MDTDRISRLEIDLLLLFYTLADEHGKVDIASARAHALEKLNVMLPEHQIYVQQKHIDILMDMRVIPDTRSLFQKFKLINHND